MDDLDKNCFNGAVGTKTLIGMGSRKTGEKELWCDAKWEELAIDRSR